MGVITEAMTRLRHEIGAWHHARAAWRGNLARQTEERRARVLALCSGFERDRSTARRAWFGLTPAGRQAAGIDTQRPMAELAESDARAERQPSAPVVQKPQPPETAAPVAAPVAPPPAARWSPSHKPKSKRSKKH